MRALAYFASDPTPIPREIVAYLEECRRTDKAPSTVYAYKRDLADFADFAEQTLGAPFTVGAVSAETVIDYRAFLRIRRLEAATINRHLASIKGLMHYAVATGLIAADPTVHIKATRLTPSPPKSLSPADRARLLAVVSRASPRDAAIVAVMLYAGLRVAETAALRLDDVQGGQVRVMDSKGRRDRVVPANDVLKAALAVYLEVRPLSRDERVFLGQRRTGLSVRMMQVTVRTLGAEAGLDGLTCHQLRHTFGRDLLRAGVDIMTVSQLLGHASLNTTMVYVRASEEDLREAVQRLIRRQ